MKISIDKKILIDTVIKNSRVNSSILLKQNNITEGEHEIEIKINNLDTLLVKYINTNQNLFIRYDDQELFNEKFNEVRRSLSDKNNRTRIIDSLKVELNKGTFDKIVFEFVND
ncbi:hypothetical protein LZQ00_16850 [Sphingobacterium sp. SRCM116780]|uniref:hypothetical protein n=1 Tax=Sphingobacterium sp. SRCM116780 TaxID=2907623 RepID=UPI001F38AC6E|nr:hypothetical protein [Sphingobacterium sp. SRCM116780]UIR55917.1 hypothetical protein LZQ00_16850 [Sphingobacterium sp. SRCM116780]